VLNPLILYGCETWSVTLRKEHRSRVSENTVLRDLFKPSREVATGGWKSDKMRSFLIYTLYQILLWLSNQER